MFLSISLDRAVSRGSIAPGIAGIAGTAVPGGGAVMSGAAGAEAMSLTR